MRNIFIVNATVLDSNGNFSTVSGFPKRFDSESYSGNVDTALRRAKAAYHAQLAANYGVDNRLMQTVTLELANGQTMLRESEGAFPPDPEPEPEPTPEPEEA